MIKNYFFAARPKTLVAAIIPSFLAHSYYVFKYDQTSYYYLGLCLLGALLIQISTNFYNDAIDFKKGADGVDRVGPKRMSATGALSPLALTRVAAALNLFVVVIGYFIFKRGGPIYLLIGASSIYFSFGYTGGPFPLAYLGLGELFVLLYFGIISVCASFYLYALELELGVFIIAAQMGLLSTSLIMANNYRDRHTDIRVGKRTLATKLNPKTYLFLFYLTIFLPHILQFYFISNIRSLATIFSMGVLVKIHTLITQKNPAMNDVLKFCGIHLLLFGIFSSFGFLW